MISSSSSLLHSKDLQISEAHQFIGLSQDPTVMPSKASFFLPLSSTPLLTAVQTCPNTVRWQALQVSSLPQNIHVKIKSQEFLKETIPLVHTN